MNLLQLETMTRLRKAVEADTHLDNHAVFDMSAVSVTVGLRAVTVNTQGVIRLGSMSLTTDQALTILQGLEL